MSEVRLADEVAHGRRGVWRAITRMSAPTIASGCLKSSWALVDTFVAGRLSTVSLAGLSAAVFFVWMFHSLSTINSIGALSVVARARGAGDDDAVRAAFRRALALAPALGLVTAVAFGLLAPVAIGLMDLAPEVTSESRRYLVAIAVAGPCLYLFDTAEQSFRGAGDARTPLLVATGVALSNLVLNPVLAFGLGPAPALGVVGIAVATGVSWLAGGATLFSIARRRGLLRPSTAAPPRAGELWRVGLPTAASGVGFDLIWVVLTPLIAVSGPAALAAVAIGHRLESISYLVSNGIAIACASLVGQAVGMGREDLARGVAFRCALFGLAMSGLWIALILALGELPLRLFSDDEAVVSFGLDYLALAAVPAVVQAIEQVFVGAFSGTGRTALPSAIAFFTYGTRIPFAWRWAPVAGAVGVFAAIGVTALGAGLLVTLAFVLVGARRAGRNPPLSPTP
jgi:putative MATE family efflux protein